MNETMIIIWAVVVAMSLLIEFFTSDFFSICFAGGGIVSLIFAACNLNLYFQIPAFILITLLMIIFARPAMKKFVIKKTIPTNIDANFGKKVKLLDDVKDGKTTVKLNDIVWTAVCEGELKKDDIVTIISTDGNKLVVKGDK